MSNFMGYLNRNLSIEIGKLHDWRGPMWQGRYHHSVVDDEPTIQIERLLYLLEQGVKEGLVLSPTEWPGVHFATALMDQKPLEGLWIDRTAIWAAKNRGESFDAAQTYRENHRRVPPTALPAASESGTPEAACPHPGQGHRA